MLIWKHQMPCSRPTLYGLDLDWSQPVYTDRQFKQTRMEYRETQLSVSTAEVPVKLKRLWGEAGALWQQKLRLVGLALSTRSGVWHRWQGLMTEHPSQRDLVGTPCPAHPGGAPTLWHIHREADPNTNLLLLAVQSRVHISPLHFYPPTYLSKALCFVTAG